MAFLKKLSDTFWSLVSPDKKNATPNTPQTLPKATKPPPPTRRISLDDIVNRSSSMSPVERVESWRARSVAPTNGTAIESRKRKRPTTPTNYSGAGARQLHRHRKIRKMDGDRMDFRYTSDRDDESDVSMQEGGDEAADDASSISSNIGVRHRTASPSAKGYASESEDEPEIGSLIVSESELERSARKPAMPISPSAELLSHGVSTEELRAQGWDDDHIVLVQKLALRGFEPLMPNYWKFEYRFHMPDSLFTTPEAGDGDAIISSLRGDHYRATMALEKLLELGGRVRDRVYLQGQVRPEQQVRRTLNEYIKWADDDSGLDRRTAIPILTIETQRGDTDAEEIKRSAHRKCAALAQRYRNAFRVRQSIESSPGSRTSTQISYPTPTLYAIIASHTLVALTAFNAEDVEPEIKIVAMFELKDKDYDVWNALALAIIVCHVRNVQIRMAEETGLGLKSGGRDGDEIEEDDPDA